MKQQEKKVNVKFTSKIWNEKIRKTQEFDRQLRHYRERLHKNIAYFMTSNYYA